MDRALPTAGLWLAPVIAMIAAALTLGAGVAHAADGARLYQRRCAACHGENGQGGVGVPLALPEFQATATNEYLRTTIRRGRPGRVMPAFEDLLSANEIEALVDHLRSLVDDLSDVELADAPAEDADPRRGAQLYAEHCASCHGEDGGGGHGTGVTFSRPRDLPIIAPALNNRGFLAAASDRMIKTALMRGRAGTPMDSFLEQGLSEQDIDDIVVFVRSFEDQPPPAEPTDMSDEPMVLTVDSPYDLEQTVANIKRAVVGHNFRVIRVQRLEEGLYPEGEASGHEVMVYACNFNFLYEALAIDPRVGLFLPCRITAVERDGQVKLMSINPKRLSALYNNRELDEACARMYDQYMQIMREATF